MEPLRGSTLPTYQEHGYRWVILILFSTVFAVAGIDAVACAPITTQVADVYSVSVLAVEMSMLIAMFVYLFLVFPANYFVDKYEIRAAVNSS